MITAGKYKAKCAGIDFGKTKTDKNQIGLKFIFQTVDAKGEPETESLTWYGYFHTPGAKEITVKTLKFCGWNGDLDSLMAAADGQRESAQKALPNDVELDVIKDTYEGVDKWKINWVNEVGGGGIAMKERLDEGQRRKFKAELGQELKSLFGSVGAPAPAKPKAPPPPADFDSDGAGVGDDQEDDIPFLAELGGYTPCNGRLTLNTSQPQSAPRRRSAGATPPCATTCAGWPCSNSSRSFTRKSKSRLGTCASALTARCFRTLLATVENASAVLALSRPSSHLRAARPTSRRLLASWSGASRPKMSATPWPSGSPRRARTSTKWERRYR